MNSAFTLREGMNFYLVGIGGTGMSAIARVLLGRGFGVSGSDRQKNGFTIALQADGAAIYQGHNAKHIDGADALVISSAIPADNPEVAAAQGMGLPVLKRSDLLGHLMEGKIGIGVAGTHGKTTITGMIAQIFMEANLDPTVIVGGDLAILGSNGRYGSGAHFIIEADEYDHMFLGLRPQMAVIANLEHDHPDIFPTAASYSDAFRRFLDLLPDSGAAVICADDTGAANLLQTNRPGVKIIRYGVDKTADLMGLNGRANPLGGTDFIVQRGDDLVGLARLRVPGKHNIQNALAAIAVALEAGICFDDIRRGLAEFGGMGRRFQTIGIAGGVDVVDDYAHHPTEIRATLAAARQRYPGRRVWAIWQPHTFSRAKLLTDEFAASFGDADRVVALDIYRSRETDDLGIDSGMIVEAMNHPAAIHIPHRADAAAYILDRIRPGDVALTLGAGDGNLVGEWILDELKKRAT